MEFSYCTLPKRSRTLQAAGLSPTPAMQCAMRHAVLRSAVACGGRGRLPHVWMGHCHSDLCRVWVPNPDRGDHDRADVAGAVLAAKDDRDRVVLSAAWGRVGTACVVRPDLGVARAEHESVRPGRRRAACGVRQVG
jgi:hypothetical protein